MKFTPETSRGDWLLERAGSFGSIGGRVGTGFEAYVRILHPAQAERINSAVTDEYGIPEITAEATWPWSEVARRKGKVMHPLVDWDRLRDHAYAVVNYDSSTYFSDGWRVGQIIEGWFDPELLALLTPHLRTATTTPDELTAGIWVGSVSLPISVSWASISTELAPGQDLDNFVMADFENVEIDPETERAQQEDSDALAPEVAVAIDEGPFFAWPERDMLLFETSLSELADPTWPQRAGIGWTTDFRGPTPQLIWPADHAWVVGTEIDDDSTIVAGSRALINAILSDDRFETFEITSGDELGWDSDQINATTSSS